MRIRIGLSLLTALLLVAMQPESRLYASPFLINKQAAAVQEPSKLEKQVASWVDALAKQAPFAAWQGADPQIEALGPGTHSWLVLFTKQGRHIGYMVVNATLNGMFKLEEYGLGPYPLFSYDVMKQSLTDGGLLTTEYPKPDSVRKQYVHPFAAAWEVKVGEDVYWLDAKTAEQLPLDEASAAELFQVKKDEARNTSADTNKVRRAKLNPTFDAYERIPWLMKETPFPAKEVSKLQTWLDEEKHLRYVTEPLADAMLYALPAIGYQRWTSGRFDVALDMNGARFIPLDMLLSDGTFYR